jgi:hypothetical protein
MRKLRQFTRRITRNGNRKAYYLQLDIKDFFPSINKETLFNLISKKVAIPMLFGLPGYALLGLYTVLYHQGRRILLKSIPFNKSLFGKDNKCGLPIGNLTSQFFANVYLNELDQFVKHTLKCRITSGM